MTVFSKFNEFKTSILVDYNRSSWLKYPDCAVAMGQRSSIFHRLSIFHNFKNSVLLTGIKFSAYSQSGDGVDGVSTLFTENKITYAI